MGVVWGMARAGCGGGILTCPRGRYGVARMPSFKAQAASSVRVYSLDAASGTGLNSRGRKAATGYRWWVLAA